MGNLANKPEHKYLVVLFTIVRIMLGKVNFTNLSCYSQILEKTYQRQFSQGFEFVELNRRVIEQAML